VGQVFNLPNRSDWQVNNLPYETLTEALFGYFVTARTSIVTQNGS